MGIPKLDDGEVLEVAARTRLPLPLARLMVLVTRAWDDKMRLAIGGAVAVRDAGWGRHTDDLDVFARPVSAKRLVRRLAAQGVRIFWITDAHAVAWLDEDNAEEVAAGEAPSVRVDVLSTVTEPEASAIRTAVPARRLGVPLKVFRPDHLAAIKFLAGRPQDLVDFDALVLRGVDVERVRYLVSLYDEPRLPELAARVRDARRPPKGVRETGGVYLSREGFERAFAEALAKERAAGKAQPRSFAERSATRLPR